MGIVLPGMKVIIFNLKLDQKTIKMWPVNLTVHISIYIHILIAQYSAPYQYPLKIVKVVSPFFFKFKTFPLLTFPYF